MPEVSRRAVMATALGGIGLAALAPAAPAFAHSVSGTIASSATGATGLAEPVRSLFSPAVGHAFTAADGDRTLRLVLTAVEDLPGAASDDEHRFALLFSTDGYAAVDGTVTLSRAGAPDVALFLTPIGRPGLSRTLQAVVDRTA
ncbi:hypothetical protein IT072_18545 [Leifsonia sp. ZF2019]|uniref:DUF6916 family protein n=1 Tax=Leifsonia sp. ZF2019 TaxID=2781978 RepID=UPI001CBCEBA6|nr:hypothetical protein [Leifsonia sp. ZF2019]UAJ79177.1 hypothetical protein IT072_18545 [Leifsonia sp. ZF2019]